jgi:hypothetical protein
MAEDACGNKQKNSPRVDYPADVGENESSTSRDPDFSGSSIFVFNRGPVAQLGARFHGMEEVVGSIPTRSTNSQSLTNFPTNRLVAFGSKFPKHFQSAVRRGNSFGGSSPLERAAPTSPTCID